MGKPRKYTIEQLREHAASSVTYAELLTKLGLGPHACNYTTVRSRIQEYEIDISHFVGQAWLKSKTAQNCESVRKQIQSIEKPWDEVFCINSPHKISAQYRLYRLVKYSRRKLKCECCELIEWNNSPIVFELHHKNKKTDDNRECNLEILCPNCHRQKHISNTFVKFFDIFKEPG